MSFPLRIIAALSLLLCQACSHLTPHPNDVPVIARQFHFDDGGAALYFVLDKRARQENLSDVSPYPDTYLFVIPGSDCTSMHGMLPDYFNGLDGAVRIFILHKRFITTHATQRCTTAFMQADHPSQWLADQSEFIRTELAAAKANGQMPHRIAIVGISEGAEIAPILARRIPGITHLALLGNGGMDPFDTYRLQMERHGFRHALQDIARLCINTADEAEAAERTCLYWRELRDIRHTDNLLALDIPVFIAMGEADTMVPIDSAWFIHDKFAAHGKPNLQLLTFPDTGHDFRRGKVTVLPYLWDAMDQWLKK